MKVVTFGELMIRLQPYNYERFVQADHLEFTFGGGEANVAVSLANYGLDAAYVTKLPAHAIGQAAVNSLRRYGVDTSMIVRGGDRVGIYFNEKGASQRGSVCIYDRAHSAIQESQPSDFDWDKIFEGVDWFHFTGITPALGPNLVETCKEACKAAKAHGVKISCDLNYRGKLWTRQQAREAMTELCQYVDVCISNEEDAKDVFGIEAEATDIYAGEINHEGYKSVAKQLADKFGFEKVAITLRESHSASDNGWSAMLYDAASNEYCFSKKYELRIIDRVGGGDSFGGGLIYALLNGKSTQDAVEFAVAASALKHTIEGDYNMVTVAEVEKLAGGDGSGRIQRQQDIIFQIQIHSERGPVPCGDRSSFHPFEFFPHPPGSGHQLKSGGAYLWSISIRCFGGPALPRNSSPSARSCCGSHPRTTRRSAWPPASRPATAAARPTLPWLWPIWASTAPSSAWSPTTAWARAPCVCCAATTSTALP